MSGEMTTPCMKNDRDADGGKIQQQSIGRSVVWNDVYNCNSRHTVIGRKPGIETESFSPGQ